MIKPVVAIQDGSFISGIPYLYINNQWTQVNPYVYNGTSWEMIGGAGVLYPYLLEKNSKFVLDKNTNNILIKDE